LRYFRATALIANNKDAAGFDPVTIADREAERAIREVLDRLRPQDSILGEEEAARQGTSGLTWVIDPIDGTRSFISGLPVWGTLIALDAGTGPVMGLIDQPYIGERYLGGFGMAHMTRAASPAQPLCCRSCARLSDAILFSTFPEIGTASERAGFEAVRDQARLTRYGTDCYAYALLAAGQIDLVIEAGLHPYDIQGPQAVVEAAGGIVTTWDGGPAHMGGQILAAGNAKLHTAALEILSKVG